MRAGQPLVPVRKLKRHSHFPEVYVCGVGKEGVLDPTWKLLIQDLSVIVQYSVEPGAGGPFDDGFGVQPRSRLIGRIPGPPRIYNIEGPDIAGDLIALLRRQPMKHRPRANRIVRIVEILEIAPVLCVAVCAVSLDRSGATGSWVR